MCGQPGVVDVSAGGIGDAFRYGGSRTGRAGRHGRRVVARARNRAGGRAARSGRSCRSRTRAGRTRASSTGSRAARSRTRDPCMAVGSFVSSKGIVLPLIERWNGKRWVVSKGPVKKGAIASALVAVSCVSPTSCIAVGNVRATVKVADRAADRTVERPRVEGAAGPRADGRDAQLPRSGVVHEREELLRGRQLHERLDVGSPLVVRWNGSKWTIMKQSRTRRGGGDALTGVSCVGTARPSPAGRSGRTRRARRATPTTRSPQRMARGKWTVVPSPKFGNDPVERAHVGVVHRARRAASRRVRRQSGLGAALIERWNGAKWKVVVERQPPRLHVQPAQRHLVRERRRTASRPGCSRWTRDDATLVNRWNGRRWEIQPSAAAAGRRGARSPACRARRPRRASRSART